MLILTRRVGETLNIGDDVSLTVLGSRATRCVSASRPRRMWPCIARKSPSACARAKSPEKRTKTRKIEARCAQREDSAAANPYNARSGLMAGTAE